jgi:hypothetical protein
MICTQITARPERLWSALLPLRVARDMVRRFLNIYKQTAVFDTHSPFWYWSQDGGFYLFTER